MTSRRTALAALALLGLAQPGLAQVSAAAQRQAAFPTQTIKFVVPYPAGGLPDTVARIVGKRLQERLGQSVVVENRAGAAGAVGANALATSPADGYTLMVSDGAIVSINPQVYSKLSYEPKDLAPVAFLAQAPLFLAVHPKVPVGTMTEFIDYVKARPGQLNYGSSGVGSIHHISMEGLRAALQLDMTHVPYKGTGESVPALLGGHVDVLFSAYPSLSGAAGSNRVRLLASNGVGRSSLAPEVPAVSEFIPGFNFASIVGVYARLGTPAAVMQKIATEVTAIVKEPDVVRQLATVGVEPTGGGPDVFERVLHGEMERVGKVVRGVGIKFE
jgi:tripartite-type tricarboxylate transporter receptor subunit TctC